MSDNETSRAARPTILITGATGSIGRSLLQHIGKKDFRIIAGIPPSLSMARTEGLRDLCDDIIELDYDNASTVTQAFERVEEGGHAGLAGRIDYLFLIPSKSEERALEAKRLIAVGIENNIKYIVLVSLLDCNARTGILAAQFRYIEQYIEATGVPYTILRSAPLQENFLDFKSSFLCPPSPNNPKTGCLATISLPIGIGAFAPINSRDVADVARKIMYTIKDGTTHFGKTYRLTGPELLSGVQIAGKASNGLKRPVMFVNKEPPEDAYKTQWAKILDLELYSLISRGFFTAVSSDVEHLIGRKGKTIESFFEENASFFNDGVDQDSTHSKL